MPEYDAEFKNLRNRALHRDDFICQDCGVALDEQGPEGVRVHVHHEQPENKLNNLVSLCGVCHNNRHSGTGVGRTRETARKDARLLAELESRSTKAHLLDVTGFSQSTLRRRLNVLVAAGHVEKVHDSGLYELVDDPRA
jgi:Fe2+ or Zn2+ uptake regulation protein